MIQLCGSIQLRGLFFANRRLSLPYLVGKGTGRGGREESGAVRVAGGARGEAESGVICEVS